MENQGESDHFLEIPRECRDFRDCRDSSSEKTPFVMTPFSGPDFFSRKVGQKFAFAVFPRDGEWPKMTSLSAPPNPPEFSQRRLSRVKRRSSPARGYKFGRVCSYMAGHFPGILMTGRIGTHTHTHTHTQICTPSLGTTAV